MGFVNAPSLRWYKVYKKIELFVLTNKSCSHAKKEALDFDFEFICPKPKSAFFCMISTMDKNICQKSCSFVFVMMTSDH